MDQKSAIVLNILSRITGKGNSLTAPTEMYEDVRIKYEEAESELKDAGVSTHVSRRDLQKSLTYHPSRGLTVHDRGGSDLQHWSKLPEGMLVQTSLLLPKLLDEAHKHKVAIGATNLSAGSDVAAEGQPIRLVAMPKPKVVPIDLSDDPVRPVRLVPVKAPEPAEDGEDLDSIFSEDSEQIDVETMADEFDEEDPEY